MFDKLKSKTIIMNHFNNVHGLKGCILLFDFKKRAFSSFFIGFFSGR